MNEQPKNYKRIQSYQGLPQGRFCTVVCLDLYRADDAIQYAEQHPERAVYWIVNQGVAVWYKPTAVKV